MEKNADKNTPLKPGIREKRKNRNPAKTTTLSGEEWKDSSVVECIGSMDEANAFLGLARVFSSSSRVRDLLLNIQRTMFKAGCEVSLGEKKIGKKELELLEEVIREIEKEVEIPHSFLILETSEETAFLNVARTAVRRAERRAVSLYRKNRVGLDLVQWLNRLSYLIYLLILLAGDEKIEV